MTTHARGGVFLDPEARAVVDIGALNGRAISVAERKQVLLGPYQPVEHRRGRVCRTSRH